MSVIHITLPDGSKREFEAGTTAFGIAKSISEGLARQALAAEINGKIVELSTPIHADADLKLFTWRDTDGKSAFWHSSAHILAEAVQELYPDAKFGIGPPVENGFYYDIDFGDEVMSENELPALEKKMKEMAKKKSRFEGRNVSKEEALAFYKEKGNEYKVELIENLTDGDITFYTQGNFTDLCRGGHIPDTGIVKAVKLLNVAGAYWRGNDKNKQLTRLYGITFPKQKELDEYLTMLEEAKKRDHRKLGKELDLFTFSDKVGQGLPLWLPKGAILRDNLERFLRKVQTKGGYQPVVTPHIGSKELYVTSGHYEKYGKDSFQPIQTPDNSGEFLLKPMNCPHHCEIYKSRPHSYKDLPIRMAEFGTVYRYEQSGELHGLTRVRGFTQDDAHIFCRADQVKEEFVKVIDLVMHVFETFGFNDYTAQISLRDKEDRSKYIGDQNQWDEAERAIIESTSERNLRTVTEYGEAAFYGPKFDFMVRDAIGRKWQLGTIQVDYQLPERFELEYTAADNSKQRPVMIHRAPFGSLERFTAILIEHTAGNFPVWLAPEQAIILPISEKFHDYADRVKEALQAHDIRADIDERAEKIGRKIRDAEVSKTPYMLIVGEKEEQESNLSVRQHGHGDIGNQTVAGFAQLIQDEIRKATEKVS